MIGEVIGSYRILAKLAEGGMGSVYRAEHQLIGRLAAVKVLHPELTTNKDVVNRFFNEAKATSAIKHPGIVEVFDFGYLPSGHAYLVMELLEGHTLAQWRRARGPVSEGEAAMMLRGVCSALAAAHAKGIVHRDLKPDNIYLVPDAESPTGTRSKLLDFGIAKLTDVGVATSATKTGAVMGTPTYMSPEQCRGSGAVDHRADLYSIGCMFFELLAGRPPFVRDGAGELIGSHLFVQPEPPSKFVQGISPDVEGLIMALLDKQPERRVQTARELATALGQIAQRHGWLPLTTDLDARASMQQIASPDQRTVAAQFTPASFTPASYTPAPGPVHAPSEKPTTLSGAASQTVPPPAPARGSGLRIGLIASGIVAVAVIGFVALRGGSKETTSTPTPAQAAAPTPVEVRPAEPTPAEPTPVTPTTADTKPADTEPVATTKPADTKPADTEPVATTKPADTEPVATTKPADTKPTDTEPVATTKPADTKPVATTKPNRPTKPTTTRPTKPTKPTKPDKPTDLLETDL